MCCSVLQCVAVGCSVLQCVAARGQVNEWLCVCVLMILGVGVLVCVAVCCSVLQCVAVRVFDFWV